MANENEISQDMQDYLQQKRTKQAAVKQRVFADGVSEDMKELIKDRDKKSQSK